jgi:heme oxygenase
VAIRGRHIHGIAMTSIPAGSPQGAPRSEGADGASRATKANSTVRSVHHALRRATWAHYALIDRLLLQVDLGLLRDYQLLLKVHFDTLQMLECSWRLEDRLDFGGMLACLQADLAALGLPQRAFETPTYKAADDADSLGVAFVIRGSRHIAAILRRRVLRGAPTQYLDFTPVIRWPQFLLQLEDAAVHPGGIEGASEAARRAFDTLIVEFTLALSPPTRSQ